MSGHHARAGDVLKPGDRVATLVAAHPRQVVADVEERRGAVFAQGSRVLARCRTGDRETVPATVIAVSGDVAALPQRVWTNPGLTPTCRAGAGRSTLGCRKTRAWIRAKCWI